MGSLFTSFNAGVSGIRAAQSGLNTTSHNLANTKTAGYTRQQNIQTDTYYQNVKIAIDGSTIQTGMGGTVAAIRQVRDIFLDKEYRLQAGRQSFYEKLAETEREVEDIFGELEGVEFQNSLQSLWNVMEEMSTNPEDITKRQLFVSTAESFLETAQNAYDQLNTYQTSLNTEIKDQVYNVNKIGEQIAFYNGKVARAEAAGLENANDYRDARNLLMDELATYANYNYEENTNGTVQIYIENALFVDGELSFHMGCEKMTDSELYYVRWLDNGYGTAYQITEAYATENKTDVGSLRGILNARGSKVADYTDMPQAAKPVLEDYLAGTDPADTDAYQAAVDKYKGAVREYEDTIKLYNNTTANSIITQIQAQFDLLVHNVVVAINDAFAPNLELYGENVEGLTGTAVNAKTGKEFDLSSLGDKKFHVLDVINCPIGTDDHETIGTEIFSRSQIDRYQILTLENQIYTTDENGNQIGLAKAGEPDENGDVKYTLYLYNEEDVSDIDWLYTMQSLVINKDLLADYSLLEVKANPELGLYGAYAFEGNLFRDLLHSWDEEIGVLDPNSLATYTYDDYYSNMIGAMGTRGSIWNNMVTYQKSLTESIEDRRQQMSGVSTNEEMISMLKYQHAYNAASRYITTIDAMLQYLIERLA